MISTRTAALDDKMVVSLAPHSPGEVILVEQPLIVLPAAFHVAQLFKLYDLPDSIQEQILSLSVPETLAADSNLSRAWASIAELPSASPEQVRQLQRFASVLQYNGIEGPNGGTALYPKCCRINHSCSPNAAWHVLDAWDKSPRVVRALVPIAQGEELTVSYLSDEDLLRDTTSRQQLLASSRLFQCWCTKCSQAIDRARAFPCTACGSTVCVGESACGRCGVPLEWEPHLAVERHLQERVRVLDGVLSSGARLDIRDEVLEVSAACSVAMAPTHWLLAKIKYLEFEVLQQTRPVDAVATLAAITAVVAAHSAVTTPLARIAWELEFQGDWSRRVHGSGDAQYTAAQRLLQVVLGTDQGLAAKIKGRKVCCAPECSEEPASVCGRCKTAGYCSRACQTGHWRDHKVWCKQQVNRKV